MIDAEHITDHGSNLYIVAGDEEGGPAHHHEKAYTQKSIDKSSYLVSRELPT